MIQDNTHAAAANQTPQPVPSFHQTVLFQKANEAFRSFLGSSATKLRFGGNEHQRGLKEDRYSTSFLNFFMVMNPVINEVVAEKDWVKFINGLLDKSLENFRQKPNQLITRLDSLIEHNADNATVFMAAQFIKAKGKQQKAVNLYFDLAVLEVLIKHKLLDVAGEVMLHAQPNAISAESLEAVNVLAGIYASFTDVAIGNDDARILNPVMQYSDLARPFNVVDNRIASYLASLGRKAAVQGLAQASAEIEYEEVEAEAPAPAPAPKPTRAQKRQAPTQHLRYNTFHHQQVALALFEELTGRRPIDIADFKLSMNQVRGMNSLEKGTDVMVEAIVKNTLAKDPYARHMQRAVKRLTSGERYQELDDDGQAIMRKMLGLREDADLPMQERFGRPFLMLGVDLASFPEPEETDVEDAPGTVTEAYRSVKNRVHGVFAGKGWGFGSK